MESNAERILLDVMAGERAVRRGETNSWAQEGHSDESVAASLGMEDQLPDEELVSRYRSGDRAALELLVRRHESRVYSIAYQMTGRREDALDLVQEIFLRVIQALPRFQGRSAFRTWLYRVASNTCLDHLRRQKRGRELFYGDESLISRGRDGSEMLGLLHLTGQPEDPDTMCEARAKRYFIQQAIAGMPERDRLVLVLRDVLGFTSEEVAEAMTLSVSAVKARLVRARAALRKRLSHDIRFGRYATAGRFRFDRDGKLE